MTDEEFKQWLSRDNEIRCVLVEMDYIYESLDSPTGPALGTLYFSDREFFDDVTDHPYVDCIKTAPQFSRALSGDQLGMYVSTIGTLELDNADGQLDFLRDLAVDGSQIRFYLGGVTWEVADFKHIFTAITSKVSAPTFDRISVALKDTGLLLNKSIGGTSTVGGTGPNADRSRPVNMGFIHNLGALVLDEALLIYVHSDDGTGTVAQEVRDRGVSVYFTDNADGTFTLDASPAGVITCDILAEPIGADNVKVSDAMTHLIGTRAGLTALGLFDGPGPTFIVGDEDDYKLGISLPESRNIIDLLADVIQVSGNAFWAIKRTGEFTFGRLRLNDIGPLLGGSPSLIDEVPILEDDIDQGSFKLDHAPTQYYKYQAYMSRNWLQQTDFATSLSPDEQDTYRRPGLYLLQPDSIGTTYENAPELYHKTLTVSPVIDTLLSEAFSETDLDSLARWETVRRSMFLPWIEIVTVVVGINFYQLELGDPVRLFIAPRMGIDENGALFQIIGIVLRLTDAKIELRMARRNIIQPIPESWVRNVSVIDDSQPEYQLGPTQQPPVTDEEGNPVFTPPGGLGGGGGGFSFGGGGSGVGGMLSVRPQAPSAVTFDTLEVSNGSVEDLVEIGQLIVGGVTAGFGITPPPYEQSYASGAYSGGGGTTNVGAGVIRHSGYYNDLFADPDPNLTMPYTCYGDTSPGPQFTFNPVSSIEFYMAISGNPDFVTVTLKLGGTTVYTSGSIFLWYDTPDYFSTPPWYHFTYP